MTEPLQVGQFAIVDSEPVERGPNAGVFHGKGPVGDRAELYILAEGTTPAGESFAGHIVSAAGQAWQTLDMSLTGAVRRLFSDASRSLVDWNLKSIAQHRVSIGMVCFARRGNQAVVAQAGPSVAFHRTATGELHALYVDEEHGRPLGAGIWSEPQLTRITFGPGDRLLLVSTNALNDLDDDLTAGILALPGPTVLPDLFHRLNHHRNLTCLVIANDPRKNRRALSAPDSDFVIDATADTEPPMEAAGDGETEATLSEPDGGVQPSLFIEDGAHAADEARRTLVELRLRHTAGRALPAVEEADIPEPLRRASGDDGLTGYAFDRFGRASNSLAARAGSLGQPFGSTHALSDPTPSVDRRRDRRARSFTRSLTQDERSPLPAIIIDEDTPRVDDMAEEARARVTAAGPLSETIATDNVAILANGGALVRVRDGMGGRWKGNSTLAGGGGHLPPTWLIIVAGLGLLILTVGLITVPRMLDDDAGNEYVELVDSAMQKMQVAELIQDAGEKRILIREAQAQLLQAQDLPSAGSDIDTYLTRVRDALAVLDAVVTPAASVPVTDLSQFGDQPIAATHVAWGGGQAYVLDSASGQVIAIDPASGNDAVAFAPDAAASRGRAVSMTWGNENATGEPALLIVDTNRALWAFSPASGLRPVPLAVGESVSVTDIAVYGGDLYVLDAGGSTVWRLVPGDDGYLSPTKVLEAPEVGQARRLMVDGELITVAEDGTMHRYAGQLSLQLSQAGIDTPLASAEGPVAISSGADLAVPDPANERVIVLRRDGSFDRQYRHETFVGISAMTLDADGTGWVFSAGKLLRVTW